MLLVAKNCRDLYIINLKINTMAKKATKKKAAPKKKKAAAKKKR